MSFEKDVSAAEVWDRDAAFRKELADARSDDWHDGYRAGMAAEERYSRRMTWVSAILAFVVFFILKGF